MPKMPKKRTKFNIPHDQRNVSLHTAVSQFDRDMLDYLLKQRRIDVNYRNSKGETPLILCLKQSWANIQMRWTTWLRRRAYIARRLIEKGADINAQDWHGCTALHYAVHYNDLEVVCMLLYYGIDVSILCNDKMTAFTHAICRNRLDLAEVLIDYYADFSDSDLGGRTALYWAATHRSPLALKLVEAGADVNSVPSQHTNVLTLSLDYDKPDLFKLIWPKFDHNLLLEGTRSFIQEFICRTQNFSASDWVECVYLILESPVAFDLLYKYKSLNFDGNLPRWTCFSLLLSKLSQLNVRPSDRIGIIATCLSLGLEVSKSDINFAFTLYGFGQELELFIYGTDVYDRLSSSDTSLYFLPRYIFTQEDELGFKKKISLFRRQLRGCYYYYCKKQIVIERFLHSLGFFALPFDWRPQLLQLGPDCYLLPNFNQVIRDRLDNVPEFPSLLELARNKARQYIRQNYGVYRAYQMHDAVKNLNLPQRIRDIILFKTPVYK